MKKYITHILVILLFLATVHFWQPLTATAREDVERANLWANDLGRQPSDPNYLTLHYRIRELYFSVEPHPAHAVVFLGDSITYGETGQNSSQTCLLTTGGLAGIRRPVCLIAWMK